MTASNSQYHFTTPQGQQFIGKYRNLKPTITRNSTGAEVCNNRTDDSGVPQSWLYQAEERYSRTYVTDSPKLCLGFESFSKFATDGSDLDPYVLYVYDAVYAFAIMADKLFILQEKENIQYDFSSQFILKLITESTFPALTTGNLTFSSLDGTRKTGNVYKLLNYEGNRKKDIYSNKNASFVGEYSDLTGWRLCGNPSDLPFIPSSVQTFCNNPIYRTEVFSH